MSDANPSKAKSPVAAQELAVGQSTQERSGAPAAANTSNGADEMEVDDVGRSATMAEGAPPAEGSAEAVSVNKVGDEDEKRDGPDGKTEMPPPKPKKR